MSIPTPEEVTEALAVLRRAPGVRDIDSIGVIERKNAPIWRMTRELNELAVATDLTPVVLAEVAARHGLRITTDTPPGTPIAYACVDDYDGHWRLKDAATWATPDTAEVAAAQVHGRGRVAALYLLPAGGKA